MKLSIAFVVVGLFALACRVDASATPWGANFGHAALLEKFSWRVLDFAYPDELSRQLAIARGDFIPENGLPVGIEVWKDKLFVTVPRWMNGIPATLNYIALDANPGGAPKLTPYPNWAQNEAGACGKGLTTAYRIRADQCDRLWVLDTGTIGIGNTTVQACPYTLNVFDLNTDKLLRQYRLRDEDINANTFIANIAVDLGPKGCEDAFAYMSDELGYGLISYSWEANKSWRLEHSFFMPDPLAGDYNVGGLNFQWGEEGIFGLGLSPLKVDGFRTLYFHPLSSNREFAVSTRILRNEKLAEDSYHEFQVLEERGPLSHSTAEFIDDDGLQFYTLVDKNAIGCWNSRLPYTPANHAIIAKHDNALIFPADVKVHNGLLWFISDRMPNFLIDKLDYNDVNFRIFTVPVDAAISGTVCEKPVHRAPIHVKPYSFPNQLWWNFEH